MIELNGYTYKRTKKGGRKWTCNMKTGCEAFLIMSEEDETIKTVNERHNHATKRRKMKIDKDSKATTFRSRLGNENLLYVGFVYRKKYENPKSGNIRWVCSSMKYCNASLFTNKELDIVKMGKEHSHLPPFPID